MGEVLTLLINSCEHTPRLEISEVASGDPPDPEKSCGVRHARSTNRYTAVTRCMHVVSRGSLFPVFFRRETNQQRGKLVGSESSSLFGSFAPGRTCERSCTNSGGETFCEWDVRAAILCFSAVLYFLRITHISAGGSGDPASGSLREPECQEPEEP